MRLKNKIFIITFAGRGIERIMANELERVQSRKALCFERAKREVGVR